MQKVDIKHFRIAAQIEPNGRCVTLLKPYIAAVGQFDISVPSGFMTDFASIPRLLWWLLPPWGLYSGPAVVHDYLYTYHHCYNCKAKAEVPIVRKEADKIFYKLMDYVGVSPLRAKLMYAAVRLFGQRAWEKQGW